MTITDSVTADESFSMIAWPDGAAGTWGIRANWATIDGRPECVGLQLWRGAHQDHRSPLDYVPIPGESIRPITATAVKAIPIATIIDHLRREVQMRWRHNAEVIERAAPHLSEAERRELVSTAFESDTRRPGAPIRYRADHYADVARIYLAAWLESGSNPTQAVADHFGVSRSAAAKWVSRARALEFLSPAEHGRPGARPGPALSITTYAEKS